MAVWSWRFESSLAHPAPSGVCVWHGKPCHPESSGISRRTRRGGLPGKGSSGLFGPTFPVSSEAPRELFVCGRWAGVLGACPLPVSPSSPVGVCRWRGGGAWLNAPASKAGRGHSPLGGSNPSLSARQCCCFTQSRHCLGHTPPYRVCPVYLSCPDRIQPITCR